MGLIKQISAVCCMVMISSMLPAYAASTPHDSGDKSQVSEQDLQHFSAALQAVHQLYVEKESDQTLFNNAISGMLSGLDPHSSFLDEEDYQALQDMTQGSFGGIGIEVMPANGLIRVMTPLDDTPAYKAGIKPGDYIVRINGKSISGMSVDEAVKEMRGDPGTEVSIVILRKGESKPLALTLKREVIKIQSVKSKLLDHDYGYIRISNFESNTGADVAHAVTQLEKETDQHLKGIIIDLRNNPGGLLDASVEVSNVFLDPAKTKFDKKVVYMKGRVADMNYTAYATGKDQTHGLPIVILINGATASAAEIVAGALQDQDRAVIVGSHSFGKGSVQTLIPLPPDDKTAIKLTTALYYTPSGRSIQAEGISPDIVVPQYDIPESVKPVADLMDSESNLIGHLSNPVAPVPTIEVQNVTGKNGLSSTKKAVPAKVEDQDQELINKVFDEGKGEKKQVSLMYSDYQLYQALTILKGLSIDNQLSS